MSRRPGPEYMFWLMFQNQDTEARRYLPDELTALKEALVYLSEFTDAHDEDEIIPLNELITVCEKAQLPLSKFKRMFVSNIANGVGIPERAIQVVQIGVETDIIDELRRLVWLAQDELDGQLMPDVGQVSGDERVSITHLNKLKVAIQDSITVIEKSISFLPSNRNTENIEVTEA